METIIDLLIGVIIGILAALGIARLVKPGRRICEDTKDYGKIRKEKEDELEKKSASDIVGALDNADDIGTIKRESDDRIDDEYGKRKEQKRRDYMDGFRSSGPDRGDEKD